MKIKSIFAKDYLKSYSQCGEDCIVRFIFNTLKIKKPSYLDIGTHHPTRGNNTYMLYTEGSRGVCIEPNPDLLDLIKSKRPKDICLSAGVGKKEGQFDYYIISTSTLNTFSKEEAKRYEKKFNFKIIDVRKIKIVTLDSVINEYFDDVFPDFLSIDTESKDMEILSSINFSKSSPTVICAETISHSEYGNGKKDDKLIDFLKQNGYMVYADTYVNTIFVKENVWKK